MKHRPLVPALALAFAFGSVAAPLTFDFQDPKGVNNIVFNTDAPLESINGTATGISGKVEFDPANPGNLKGKLIVKTPSLHVGNEMMKQHLHSAQWMDVQKYPELTFETEKVTNVKTEVKPEGPVTSADVTGTMTIKGIAKKITVPVGLTYLKDKLKDRMPGTQGDLLVLRAKFSIKRSDFGINAGQFEDKVSDEIKLTLSLAGSAPK